MENMPLRQQNDRSVCYFLKIRCGGNQVKAFFLNTKQHFSINFRFVGENVIPLQPKFAKILTN